MTSPALIVGVDPGPITGIVILAFAPEHRITPSIFQCDGGSVLWLVRESLSRGPIGWGRRVLAIERFVVGPRAARSSTPRAGVLARDIAALTALDADIPDVRVVQRSAAEVKPWATNTRLAATGLLAATKGMPHARDAARHALYAAVRDCGLPDPLSKRVPCPTRRCRGMT